MKQNFKPTEPSSLKGNKLFNKSCGTLWCVSFLLGNIKSKFTFHTFLKVYFVLFNSLLTN